jgi:signal transduction histidine kinase
MSHELRTPLNAVIGFSQVMQTGLTGDLNEKQMEYLADISNSGEHLLSLINDLMDLAKIEAGKLEIFPEEIQIQAQIEDCLPFVREQAEAAGIELRFIAAHGLPPLFADPRMLRQMLVNLLTNAVKFSPPGSVVSITGDCPEAGGLVISVQDQGVGMAPEDIPKAMTPFGQTESGMHAGGTGLGLPLVREMMTLHDGTLEISSVKGEGTIASLCFPLAQVETRRLRQS